MTTIAYRAGVLAADTQMTTDGDLKTTIPGLKLFIAGRYAVGFTGDLRYAPVVERWFLADCPLDDDEFTRLWNDEWDILAMDEDGNLSLCFVDTLKPISDQFYSVGSGSPYAFGAFTKGATAKEAVAAASRFDCFTNAVIEEITVADLRKHLAK